MVVGDEQRFLTMFVTLKCEVGRTHDCHVIVLNMSHDAHVTWLLPCDV